ncbi:MAG: PrsW family glutamic-type intramembrane protease [bacterium]|nr:PrsW family glutamic-type intramembrane protease [bacterium]
MPLTNIVYALLAGILPAMLWLWFWLKEDNLHPEPRNILAITFIAGGVSVIIAIIFEKIAQDFITDSVYKYVVWAAIEEIVKFSAVAIVALRSKYMDEPIDAMIYCITVALGFSALENALFILSPLNSGQLAASIVTGNLRFIGATLVHVVSSAFIGFAVGLAFYRGAIVKSFSVIIGVIIAVALHTSFNLAIINGTATDTLKVFGWVWVATIILIILFEEVKIIRPMPTKNTG